VEGFSLDNLIAVIPAAGAGKRLGLGINKAFAKINSVPLLVHCLTMLSRTKLITRAIVVLAPDEVEEGRELLASYQGAHFANLPFVVVAGGKERQDSVNNALAAITESEGYVAVHDGARPFAGKEVFERTLLAAKEHGAAIAAVPVKDTIKVVSGGIVKETPDRSGLQAVQTPQVFDFDMLRGALKKAKADGAAITDDCSAVERLGMSVKIVEGDEKNIKITTPFDLKIAELILEEMQ
jgi:2-C-methyl-D-erythritol 4-phosphate cytidylyltransferase